MKRFIKRASRGRGFCFSLLFFILCSPSFALTNVKQDESLESFDRELLDPDLSYARLLMDTVDFLESEGRSDEIVAMSKRLLPLRSLALSERFATFHVLHKDRQKLFDFLKAVFDEGSCKDKKKLGTEICQGIGLLWTRNLDSILFYEESPGKLLKAKQALEKGECVPADLLLRELEAKEGFNLAIVDTHIRIAECLKNGVFQQQLEQRRQEMRVISGEI